MIVLLSLLVLGFIGQVVGPPLASYKTKARRQADLEFSERFYAEMRKGIRQ